MLCALARLHLRRRTTTARYLCFSFTFSQFCLLIGHVNKLLYSARSFQTVPKCWRNPRIYEVRFRWDGIRRPNMITTIIRMNVCIHKTKKKTIKEIGATRENRGANASTAKTDHSKTKAIPYHLPNVCFIFSFALYLLVIWPFEGSNRLFWALLYFKLVVISSPLSLF